MGRRKAAERTPTRGTSSLVKMVVFWRQRRGQWGRRTAEEERPSHSRQNQPERGTVAALPSPSPFVPCLPFLFPAPCFFVVLSTVTTHSAFPSFSLAVVNAFLFFPAA